MFTKILDKCRTDFTPHSKTLNLPQQRSMFSVNPSNSHIKMGLFYEMLTACLFGGQLTDSLLRQENHKRVGPMPDVWNKKRNINMLWESKACRMGHNLNLLDGQVSLYRKYQVLMPNAIISYAVWRHRLKAIKNYKEDEVTLFGELASKTVCGLIIPFSIVHTIHGMGKEIRQKFREEYKMACRRYETDGWDHCTRTSSVIWNSFLLDPQTMITRVGLKPDDYIWERYMVPAGIKLNGIEVESVPFILIADRDHLKNTQALLDVVPF